MALDHAPGVSSSNLCDPLPHDRPQRSRLGLPKRPSFPRESLAPSTTPTRLRRASGVGLQVKSTVVPPAKVLPSSEPATRNFSTEEWIEEVAKDVPMNVDSSLAHSKSANRAWESLLI